jgi:hypothetical protein
MYSVLVSCVIICSSVNLQHTNHLSVEECLVSGSWRCYCRAIKRYSDHSVFRLKVRIEQGIIAQQTVVLPYYQTKSQFVAPVRAPVSLLVDAPVDSQMQLRLNQPPEGIDVATSSETPVAAPVAPPVENPVPYPLLLLH